MMSSSTTSASSRGNGAVAGVDAVTGLPNGGLWHERVRHHVDQIPAADHAVLLVIDVDELQVVNYAHGRAVGDLALAAVGSVLRARCHPVGVPGRIGDDEFVHLFTADRDVVPQLVQHMRDDLTGLIVPTKDAVVAVSATVGAAVSPRGRLDLTRLFWDAETVLYAEKKLAPRAR